MKASKRLFKFTCALFLGSALITPHASHAQARLFEDGDRVCFIGDSITHEGAYHSFVYLYYLTRFPDREIKIWNRGISGDSIWSVLRRFDGDVASTNPTISTIMLGMNDVGRSLYGPDKQDPQSVRLQNEQLELYETRMGRLLPKIEDLGSEIILITPSIYDQTADLRKYNQFGVNNALAYCSELIRTTAETKGYGLIDFHAPMTAINKREQRADPEFSIVGADRVHPGRSLGHFVMAYLFLKEQDAPKYVSMLDLDGLSGALFGLENARFGGLSLDKTALRFTLEENSLPFPLSPSLDRALSIVPFEDEFNQQILRVRNLDKGDYELKIDNESIGVWSAAQFAEGINLADYRTPQMRQAYRVQELNDKRDRLARKLRKIAFTLYNSGLLDEAIDLNDTKALTSFFDAKTKGLAGKSYQQYYRDQFDAFLEIYPEREDYAEEMDGFHQRLYEANQPIPYTYSIKRVEYYTESI